MMKFSAGTRWLAALGVRDHRVQRALELGVLPPDADMVNFQRGETRWELFDLEGDPFERHDLSTRRPGLTRELIDAWYSYAEDVGVAVGE